MKYFISDTHFGHENIVKSRPCFSSVSEMDECLIKNWNNKVTNNDEIYILGDFSFRVKGKVHEYLQRLYGKKHLIVGNHDPWWMKEVEDLSVYFESVSDIKTIRVEKMNVMLCHYPMLEWDGSTYLIHGHVHGNKDTMTYRYIKDNLPHVLNCCVDINHFEPVTFQELLRNSDEWYER